MRHLLLLLDFIFTFTAYAQSFDNYFIDKTLRLDYIFSGDATQQHAFLHEAIQLDKWHGRRANLNHTPIQGNGQIRVYDKATNELIYILPFGSLFQEWLSLDEAKKISKSFENTFLLPFPKKEVEISVTFFNNQQEEKTILRHTINPEDILNRKALRNHSVLYEVIHASKVLNPIKVTIVAEGFTQNEMRTFMDFAHQTKENLFHHSVFQAHQEAIEIIAVQLASNNSGVTIPSQNKWVNSAVNAHFDTFYSVRYLTTSKIFHLHDLLANIPYQHIIILANTDVYGGGGILNAFSISTTKNRQFKPVVVHEFGHSFAGLADEYFYEDDVFENIASPQVEPWEKNITSLVDFDNKWKDLLSAKTPIPTPDSLAHIAETGIFEGLKGMAFISHRINVV